MLAVLPLSVVGSECVCRVPLFAGAAGSPISDSFESRDGTVRASSLADHRTVEPFCFRRFRPGRICAATPAVRSTRSAPGGALQVRCDSAAQLNLPLIEQAAQPLNRRPLRPGEVILLAQQPVDLSLGDHPGAQALKKQLACCHRYVTNSLHTGGLAEHP